MTPSLDFGDAPQPLGMAQAESSGPFPKACNDYMVDLRSPSRLCQCGSPKSSHILGSAKRKSSSGSSVHQLAQAFASGQAAHKSQEVPENKWSAFGLNRLESKGSVISRYKASDANRQGPDTIAQQEREYRVEKARQLIGSGKVKAEREDFEAAVLARQSSPGPSGLRRKRDSHRESSCSTATNTEGSPSDSNQSVGSVGSVAGQGESRTSTSHGSNVPSLDDDGVGPRLEWVRGSSGEWRRGTSSETEGSAAELEGTETLAQEPMQAVAEAAPAAGEPDAQADAGAAPGPHVQADADTVLGVDTPSPGADAGAEWVRGSGETEASIADEAEPPATDGAEPAVADGLEPAAADGLEPAAADEAEPAAADGLEPAAADGAEPAAADGLEPAAADRAEPEGGEPEAVSEAAPDAGESEVQAGADAVPDSEGEPAAASSSDSGTSPEPSPEDAEPSEQGTGSAAEACPQDDEPAEQAAGSAVDSTVQDASASQPRPVPVVLEPCKAAFEKARETWTQAARDAESRSQEEKAAAAARASAARQRREELAAAARMKDEAEAAALREAEERALEEELARKAEQDREQQRAAARERIEQREAARLRKARQREEEVRRQAELKEKAELEKAAAMAANRTVSVECTGGGLLMVAPTELQTLQRYVPEFANKTAEDLAEMLPKLHMGAWLKGSDHLFKRGAK